MTRPNPTPDEIDEFVEYVLSFYVDHLWPVDERGPVPTEEEVRAATAVIIDNYDLVDGRHPLDPSDTDAEIDLDSHCREVARDLILTRRGFKGRTWPEDVAKVFRSDHRLEHGDLIATFALDGAEDSVKGLTNDHHT
jgi:hypothetical protein